MSTYGARGVLRSLDERAINWCLSSNHLPVIPSIGLSSCGQLLVVDPIEVRFSAVNGRKGAGGQVWGKYAGSARRCVHLATVFLQHPSGHRPDRRQARQAHLP